jgi:hypothetical protein
MDKDRRLERRATKLFSVHQHCVCMSSRKVVGGMPEDISARDMAELRERVVRLEVQMAEIAKRVEQLSSYNRQLFDYLNKSGR